MNFLKTVSTKKYNQRGFFCYPHGHMPSIYLLLFCLGIIVVLGRVLLLLVRTGRAGRFGRYHRLQLRRRWRRRLGRRRRHGRDARWRGGSRAFVARIGSKHVRLGDKSLPLAAIVTGRCGATAAAATGADSMPVRVASSPTLTWNGRIKIINEKINWGLFWRYVPWLWDREMSGGWVEDADPVDDEASEWTRMWIRTCCDWLKRRPQVLHWKGFSPVCVRMCWRRWSRRRKRLPQ